MVRGLAVRQTDLKRQLRAALAANDGHNCWCYAVFTQEVCKRSNDESILPSTEGAVVRLFQICQMTYLFIQSGVHWQSCRPLMYVAHESEFVVRWVGEGPLYCNRYNPERLVTGADYEANWDDRTFKGKPRAPEPHDRWDSRYPY